MLTHHRKTVCLSLMSLDLPLWSVVETSATLYEKELQRYHLLLREPPLRENVPTYPPNDEATMPQPSPPSSRFLWLELSPYRIILTMQTHSKLSYRHYWEKGVFGPTRFWLQGDDPTHCSQMRLRNYTRSLELRGDPLPEHLRVEYELWAAQEFLGHYVLNVDIQPDD
ncbi:hypothetical protein [Vacuolonema iberomarrocanum]|uniref:hypothetical protein n=1 Tax=Vacuolonema iberomarrocanum TaxID=3454632 RepID=UPI001A0FCB94|nr:hypothetical protein [filamentous cyanobacterium LEGE 07170]